MAEVLSQSEIDALLAAVSSGNVETEEVEINKKQKSTDWIAYDLTSHEKIVRSRFAALEGIHDRFSGFFRASLTSVLKKNATVTCVSTDFLRFSDYLSNILLPTSLNILNMVNLRGCIIFVASSKLTYALMDTYYGGSERPFSKIGGREQFTSIENMIIKKVCELAIPDLKKAWKLNYPLDLEFLRQESNPQFVGSIHGTETVAVVSFDVEMESLSGTFTLIVQLRALETIQQSLSVNVTNEISSDAGQWRKHWLGELMTLELDVTAELGVATSTLKETQNWKVGDVLALQQDSLSPLLITVEGQPKARGLMGACRGNNAVSITDTMTINLKGD
jgi:flagellar motor switch protein FliM